MSRVSWCHQEGRQQSRGSCSPRPLRCGRVKLAAPREPHWPSKPKTSLLVLPSTQGYMLGVGHSPVTQCSCPILPATQNPTLSPSVFPHQHPARMGLVTAYSLPLHSPQATSSAAPSYPAVLQHVGEKGTGTGQDRLLLPFSFSRLQASSWEPWLLASSRE